jgi:hypothetical protein
MIVLSAYKAMQNPDILIEQHDFNGPSFAEAFKAFRHGMRFCYRLLNTTLRILQSLSARVIPCHLS